MQSPSSPARPHRLHRHKKFHVRPEACGEGYETFGLRLQSSSPRLPVSPAPASTPDSEAALEKTPIPDPASLMSQWEAVSEKTTSGRAARNACRILCLALALLILFVLFCTCSEWLARVLLWMRQFPIPTF